MSAINIGEVIQFGDYKWRILNVKDNTALLITEHIIEHRSYHNAYKDITWAECSLRQYLNGDFYDRFSLSDQSRIIPVVNRNMDNEWYGTIGGEDTTDSVFLLSTEEVVCHYFGDSSSKLYSKGKNQRYWFERKDENNSKRIAKTEAYKEMIYEMTFLDLYYNNLCVPLEEIYKRAMSSKQRIFIVPAFFGLFSFLVRHLAKFPMKQKTRFPASNAGNLVFITFFT